jgi:hypothetical protein
VHALVVRIGVVAWRKQEKSRQLTNCCHVLLGQSSELLCYLLHFR